MAPLLGLFITLKSLVITGEWWLRRLNRRYYLDHANQVKAMATLGITSDEFAKILAYTTDKYRFARVVLPLQQALFLAFLGFGGFGMTEQWAKTLAAMLSSGEIVTGLIFFGLLGVLATLVSLPGDLYAQLVIEAKHGFNRQTIKGMVIDLAKGAVLAVVLGGPVLAGILWLMAQRGEYWWLAAWAFLTAFSWLITWLYPALLAPWFNKFSPLADGALKDDIFALAQKINFKTSQVFVMDASQRSSHGNAYFTGLFREKRIVLFDTLLDKMTNREIIAVLAHELGHFHLHHVRWGMIRGMLLTAGWFYLLSICLPLEQFYLDFSLNGISNYGALVVFSLWYGLAAFCLVPLQSWLSRKNEFAADRFAVEQLGNREDLSQALVNLCQSNQAMPLTHPLFSLIYNSHPPLLERINALKLCSSHPPLHANSPR